MVGDFGLASITKQGSKIFDSDGTFKGTITWTAPEILGGNFLFFIELTYGRNGIQ